MTFLEMRQQFAEDWCRSLIEAECLSLGLTRAADGTMVTWYHTAGELDLRDEVAYLVWCGAAVADPNQPDTVGLRPIDPASDAAETFEVLP